MHPAGGKKEAVCVGILAADPLRSIGLQSILEDGLKLRTVILPEGPRTRDCKPTVLIVDEDFEDHPWLSAPLSHMLVRMPGMLVIVLTRGEDSEAAQKALAAGARGILPQTAQVGDIRACIRAVLRGKTWSPRETEPEERLSVAGDEGKTKSISLAQRFTPKEREVMRWLAQGHSNREIAATMGIDEATVKAHLGRMLRKADASNRVELTLRALADDKGARKPGMESAYNASSIANRKSS